MADRFSEILMEHFQEPRHNGSLAEPTGVGVAGVPGRGPYMVFHLKCENQTVVEAWFQSHNCGVTVACGSVLTEIAEGRTLQECHQITTDVICVALDGVPVDKRHVPDFALNALRMALEDAA